MMGKHIKDIHFNIQIVYLLELHHKKKQIVSIDKANLRTKQEVKQFAVVVDTVASTGDRQICVYIYTINTVCCTTYYMILESKLVEFNEEKTKLINLPLGITLPLCLPGHLHVLLHYTHLAINDTSTPGD